MLPTKEELAQNITTFSDQKLLDIIYRKEGVRPEAIEAATEELKQRKVSIEIVNDFVQLKETKKIIATENSSIPLPLHLKFLFFFAWFIPLFFGSAFRLNYKEDGMDKKLKQSSWYSIAGFIALILTTIVALSFNLGNIPTFAILFGLFGVFYAVEERINK